MKNDENDFRLIFCLQTDTENLMPEKVKTFSFQTLNSSLKSAAVRPEKTEGYSLTWLKSWVSRLISNGKFMI